MIALSYASKGRVLNHTSPSRRPATRPTADRLGDDLIGITPPPTAQKGVLPRRTRFQCVFPHLSSHRANTRPCLRVVPPSHQYLFPALRGDPSATAATAAAGAFVALGVLRQPPYGWHVAERVRQTALWAEEQEGFEQPQPLRSMPPSGQANKPPKRWLYTSDRSDTSRSSRVDLLIFEGTYSLYVSDRAKPFTTKADGGNTGAKSAPCNADPPRHFPTYYVLRAHYK